MNITSSIHRRDVRLQVLWPPQQLVGHLSTVDNATDTCPACAPQSCVYFLLGSIKFLYTLLQILPLSHVFCYCIGIWSAMQPVQSPPNTIIISYYLLVIRYLRAGNLVQTRVSMGMKWYPKSRREHFQASITTFRHQNSIFKLKISFLPWLTRVQWW